MSKQFTRQQYMNKECTHQEYYAQFVNNQVLKIVSRFKKKELIEGKDQHFNNIPLQYWDKMLVPVPFEVFNKMKELGDYPTPSGVVCILKEAARQIVEKALVTKAVPA